MGLRDRLYLLGSIEQATQFLSEYPTCIIFNAGSCHKTVQQFTLIEKALDPRDRLFLGFVRAVEDRHVSDYIAELTGIPHQSPQLILFVNAKPVYDVDSWSITQEAIEVAVERRLGPLEGQEVRPQPPVAEMAIVKPILDRLIKGEIGEQEFKQQWATLANPWCSQLMGDFNGTLPAYSCRSGGCSKHHSSPLKIKAGQVLALFKAYQ